ncbi:SAG family member [Eimeria mitis]|uniref:SAG family member n=1 Tax=Eimeria mitis TaxID=44415 RepID=U6K9W3_9EIME|nr:SAG family member [Eimeria mitis]CDJ32987.1 SAG family member [Eimeria mitis]
MTILKFLSLATAAIFFLEDNSAYGTAVTGQDGSQAGGGGGEAEPPLQQEEEDEDEVQDSSGDTVANKAERAECWEQLHEARSLVGFPEFTPANILKITEDDWTAGQRGNITSLEQYLSKVCDAMKTNTAPEELTPKTEGTFAYAIQEGENADCKAAVDYWKDAFTNFNGELPPAYTAGTKPYDNAQNVSFISLFNPQASPKVDCAYFVCPAATQKSKSSQDNTGTEKDVKALICVTTPSALTDDQKPFTGVIVRLRQEQWDQITAGLKSSSAIPEAPAFLALVVIAFAAVLF